MRLSMLLGATTAQMEVHVEGHTGCEKRLTKVCPEWESSAAKCLACVAQHMKRLEKNCTKAQAEKKCRNLPPTPSPEPPPPHLPPMPPDPSAPRPHIVLWVVDDQGWANLGFHNPGNVFTPHTDEMSKAGIRLERHYTFRWCAPTRSALLTGRLPYHVLQTTNHVDRGFAMLPAKLKQVGYATHQVGKWHLGNLAPWMTPVGRGFDTSLGYLSGGEDHYTQFQKTEDIFGCRGVDLYASTAPAVGLNGTYGTIMYTRHAVELVEAHNMSTPLFLYMALQVMHAPQEVPSRFSDLYSSTGRYSDDYAIMNGMATAADEALGNVTAALMARKMWQSTLFVYTADNGGPAGQLSSGHSGNNWPLRGGKTNLFEGGVRVAAFVSGGFVPSTARGSSAEGYIHVCDWYHTLIKLAGGEPADDHPDEGLPPTDALDVWPYLSSGAVGSSPRTQMLLSSEPGFADGGKLPSDHDWNGALIVGDWKLILGRQTYGFWQAPRYPNASTDHASETTFDCGKRGCLFNVRADPSEYVDLSKTQPVKLAQLLATFVHLNATRFEAPKIKPDEGQCKAYAARHGGFLGPCAWPRASTIDASHLSADLCLLAQVHD